LFESLTDTCHISVAKDSEDSLHGAFAIIAIDRVLVRQEFNDCLAYSHFAR
jgi:hypothetical protein